MLVIPTSPPILICTTHVNKVPRLVAISDKQPLSSALWKKGSMREDDSRTSQQSLLHTVSLCGRVCVSRGWVGPGEGIRANHTYCWTQGWILSHVTGFFRGVEVGWIWRWRNDEGTCFYSTFLSGFQSSSNADGIGWPNLRLFLEKIWEKDITKQSLYL